MKKIECGNANPKGNIWLNYKGGCRKWIDIKDSYRCVGCGGWFHKECIVKHFELEEEHDIGRNNLKAEFREIIKKMDCVFINGKGVMIKRFDILKQLK